MQDYIYRIAKKWINEYCNLICNLVPDNIHVKSTVDVINE